MKRREFLVVVAGAAAWPLHAGAQQPKLPKVGVLTLLENPEPFWSVFRDALRDLGLVAGKTIHLELRKADGKPKLLAEHAAELVRSKFDVIATIQTPAAFAAKQATTDIPIVMISAADPVATGLVSSLARPGGNITGMSSTATEAAVKTLELMREILPSLRRVAVLVDAPDAFSKPFLEQSQLAGRTLAIEIRPIIVRAGEGLDAAFAAMSKERVDAVIIQPSFPFRAVELALKQRVPAVAPNGRLAAAGCLMTFSQDNAEAARKAADYVDRILKGAKPADLPIQQPTKFELILNLKSAKALGITVPQSILLRADKVIE